MMNTTALDTNKAKDTNNKQAVTLVVNGNTHTTQHSNVQALLDELGLSQGRYAVEIDAMLVPKSRLCDTAITNGMTIEVVQAVGGG